MMAKIYSIRDLIAEEFGPLYEARNDAVASRNYMVAMEKTVRPSDYKLYCLGHFDSENGLVTGHVKPREVAISRFSSGEHDTGEYTRVEALTGGNRANSPKEALDG